MSKRASSKARDPRFEYPDPTPVEVPVRFREGRTSQTDLIKQQIRVALSEAAESEGFETWEEANDFDVDPVDDEPDFISRYEFDELLPESNETLDGLPSSSTLTSHQDDTVHQADSLANHSEVAVESQPRQSQSAEIAGGTPSQGATETNPVTPSATR